MKHTFIDPSHIGEHHAILGITKAQQEFEEKSQEKAGTSNDQMKYKETGKDHVIHGITEVEEEFKEIEGVVEHQQG